MFGVIAMESIVWIAIILVLFAGIIVLNVKFKKNIAFAWRVVISTLIGLAAGIIYQVMFSGYSADTSALITSQVTQVTTLIGDGFIALLRMLVVPLVFIAILNVIVNQKEQANLGKMTIRTVSLFVITVAVAALIGIGLAMAFNLGSGMTLPVGTEGWAGKEYKGIVDTIIGLLPRNPIAAMAEGNVIAVVIFAAFIGIATNKVDKKYPELIAPVKTLITAGFKIMTRLTGMIIQLIPYGVFALMFNLAATQGFSTFQEIATYFVVMLIGLVLLFAVHMIILISRGINPVKFVLNAAPALLVAFTSSSSFGTLPVTIETLEDRMGVSTGVANFSASLGSTMGMNACAGLFPAVLAVMIANMSGVAIDLPFIFLMLVVIVIGSFGIAGIPGTASIAATVVLGGLGLPFAPVALIWPIDPIIDMGRTMVNVNGAMVISTVVDKSMGLMDQEKFNEPNKQKDNEVGAEA
ncbi:cation:dicarboxylase symporter family transporter [Culicoidibacter larvae]|uniref:L-cystine uptake protein TcyP n=2 Tax=Culicoidibacter larvae TaxID=2579976 RepID=A0A5R8QFK5_9FIRM|nr:cation:dicarboxylase symporter family transporter [Culicoidibacter larvae]